MVKGDLFLDPFGSLGNDHDLRVSDATLGRGCWRARSVILAWFISGRLRWKPWALSMGP